MEAGSWLFQLETLEKERMNMKKQPSCLGYIGGDIYIYTYTTIILPSYVGILIITHNKDPY